MFDADLVARRIMAPGGQVFERIVRRFGPGVVSPDGALDRERLAELVFADPAARRSLERLTHPEIFMELARTVGTYPPGEVIVIEAALLSETADRWTGALKPDAVVVVLSRPEDQRRRLTSLRGLSERAAEARIAAQRPWDQKLETADYVLQNTGSVEELEEAAERVWEDLTSKLENR